MDIGGDLQGTRVPAFDIMDHMTPNHWWNAGYWWLDTQLQPAVQQMQSILKDSGVDHDFVQVPGARHTERAWSERIDKPLLYLYGQ